MAKSVLSSSFGFSTPEQISAKLGAAAAARFRRGPSVDALMEAGLSEGEAGLKVLYHLFELDPSDPKAPDQLRNALQWYAAERTKDITTKDGRTLNIVDWSAYRIPAPYLAAARAGSLSGLMAENTIRTLAHIYYNDAKARDDIRAHRAEWADRPFVPMTPSRPEAPKIGAPGATVR